MNDSRRIEVEVEVPVTPEEAWEAIATGPGITSWFMPAQVEPEVGGSVIHHHDADMSSSGTITAYDRPRRFAYEEAGDFTLDDGEAHAIATEFLIEAQSGGTSIVRVVMSGFGEGDAWDNAIESFTSGWHQALLSLRLYAGNFLGEPVGSINVGNFVKANGDVWERFAQSLGLPPAPGKGDHIATATADSPVLTGTIEEAGNTMLTLLLEQPAPGIGLIGVGGAGDQAFVTVRAQLFGTEAADIAKHEHARWRTWLANHWSES